MQFDLINYSRYEFTSDDVLFQVFSIKNEINKSDLKKARLEFFQKVSLA
ncbi:MAG: DUF6157 family protein [Candidatus Kapaibacterium sp.]